jgi:hypothetical protein
MITSEDLFELLFSVSHCSLCEFDSAGHNLKFYASTYRIDAAIKCSFQQRQSLTNHQHTGVDTLHDLEQTKGWKPFSSGITHPIGFPSVCPKPIVPRMGTDTRSPLCPARL